MADDFKGFGAVVTGAGRGIGREIGLRLCAMGAQVAFVARSKDEIAAAASKANGQANGRGLALAVDITAREAAETIVSTALEQFGRLDILVHSAGVIAQERLEDASLTALDDMYRANVRAPYAITQAALPALKTSQGQVVFVNSTVTRAPNIAGRGGFAATQHALKAVADSLRDEVNEAGVRVISLIVGTTATPRQEHLHEVAQRNYRPERLLQPGDVAQAACAALALPRTAEVTDLVIRPMLKS
jgi:NADP-dependent 3-hydroxy acid dehydrogenase YdfG